MLSNHAGQNFCPVSPRHHDQYFPPVLPSRFIRHVSLWKSKSEYVFFKFEVHLYNLIFFKTLLSNNKNNLIIVKFEKINFCFKYVPFNYAIINNHILSNRALLCQQKERPIIMSIVYMHKHLFSWTSFRLLVSHILCCLFKWFNLITLLNGLIV